MRLIMSRIFEYSLHNKLNINLTSLKVRLEQYPHCVVVLVHQLSRQSTKNRGTRSDQRRSVWYVSQSK